MSDHPGSSGVPGGEDARLEIVRSFRAPPQAVFNAWTRVEGLAGWWGPEGFLVPTERAHIDPVTGGSFRACMVNPVSGAEFWWSGTFGEVREPAWLSFGLQWQPDGGDPGPVSDVEVAFGGHDGGTRQTFRQSPFAGRRERDGSEAGWRDAFHRLSLLLARRTGGGK